MKKLILASTSPRRKEILSILNTPFETAGSSYEEDMTLKMAPADLAMHLAEGKAGDVATKNKDAIVIGADTMIALDNEVLGKPHTKEKAIEIIERLQGRSHSVFTGFCIIDAATGKKVSKAVETKVFFKSLSREEIVGYVKTGEPIDKAGAYAIQGIGTIFIDKIEGDYFNVMGLPLSAVADALNKFDIKIF